MYVYMYVYVYTCMYIYIYVYMYVAYTKVITNVVMVLPPPIIMISRTIFHAPFATKYIGQPVDSHGITNLNILITRLLPENLLVITVECLASHLQVS